MIRKCVVYTAVHFLAYTFIASQLLLNCIGILAESFATDALPDPTLYFIRTGDQQGDWMKVIGPPRKTNPGFPCATPTCCAAAKMCLVHTI